MVNEEECTLAFVFNNSVNTSITLYNSRLFGFHWLDIVAQKEQPNTIRYYTTKYWPKSWWNVISLFYLTKASCSTHHQGEGSWPTVKLKMARLCQYSSLVYLIYKVSTMEDDAAASARDLINSQSHGTKYYWVQFTEIFLTSIFLSMSLLLL